MRIIWTQYAIDDLAAIREYLLGKESPSLVKKVTEQILADSQPMK